MAADLAGAPRTDLHVQLCGDAHVSNFGVFAAPDRRMVFSLNDFDETLHLGAGNTFDKALSEFAETYADQNERDYDALADAATSGRIQVQTGL